VKPWTAGRLVTTLVASLAAWGVLAGACLAVGSTGELGLPNREVLFIRLQVVLLASLIGAALAAAGVVYQAILHNALAEPYLLGVSSGAALFAYLWQLPAAGFGLLLGEQGFAFLGALTAVAIVFLLASRRGTLEPITMLLVGVIVNALFASVFMLLNALWKDPARPGGPLAFLFGGLQTNLTRQQFVLGAIVIGIGWIILILISGQLNAALLSDAEASSLGVHIHQLRWIGLLTASLMTASAVALSGPIGFVGLVCPHLARLMVGNDQRRLLPLATAWGAGLLAIADAISRWLSAQGRAETVLPVGVLTGLLGGPFFLLLLWQKRRRGVGFNPVG
jgi:iron complex transport system permease protein